MSRRIDLNGQVFGRWSVMEFDRTKNGEAYWICKCACGTVRSVNGYHLRSGRSTSCGCYSVELVRENKPGTTHGLKKTNPRLYRIWQAMLNRCRRKKDKCYGRYGGRGISVCEEWHKYLSFYKWAIANGYKDDLTIDRIDVNGNYEPSNCQWISMSENSKKAIKDRRQKVMEFISLASSSHGNSYIVSDEQTKILLECGISHKKLQKLSGFNLTEFAGCLISHEHKDHSKSVSELIKDGMSVYMSEGTADALGVDATNVISSMEQFNIDSLDIVPFATFHDAAEPLGFLIKSRADGDILAFATDTVNLRYRFPGLNILAIEANYSKDILDRCGKLPEKVRHRITNAHMEIDNLCEYLRELDLSQCREIHLLHLSDATSHEERFISRVRNSVPDGIKITACKK